MIESAVRFFILFTPFFALSVFVSMTDGMSLKKKRSIAFKTTCAIALISLIVYFVGNYILQGLSLTLDAFRVGAGVVLFMSGLEMVRGGSDAGGNRGNLDEDDSLDSDIAIIPLALPCTVGPGTIGALLLLGGADGADLKQRFSQVIGIVIATFSLGVILWFANILEKIIRKRGIIILSKLTGLFLVTLASQIIMEGIKNFFAIHIN